MRVDLLPRSLACLVLSALSARAQLPVPVPIPASQQRYARQYTPVTNLHDISTLSSAAREADALDFRDPRSFLSQILIPRAPGSQNLTLVQRIIKDRFSALGKPWHLEEDCFTASTPVGDRPFCNLIFTHDPAAERRLVIAAHVDSKWFPNAPDDAFVGATDSAASVALMVDLAERITPLLNARRTRDDPETTLSLLFLDGEEAFQSWTATDSIYGARHLAEQWAQPFRPPSAAKPIMTSLQRITTFVLLDLIGSANPSMYNFFHQTGWLYDRMQQAEQRLNDAGLLWASGIAGKGPMFRARDDPGANYYGRIEDDHLPFLARGVPILHLIPVPFPSVWHTLRDDASALDLPTLKAWSIILRLVTAEYLALTPPSPSPREELQ